MWKMKRIVSGREAVSWWAKKSMPFKYVLFGPLLIPLYPVTLCWKNSEECLHWNQSPSSGSGSRIKGRGNHWLSTDSRRLFLFCSLRLHRGELSGFSDHPWAAQWAGTVDGVQVQDGGVSQRWFLSLSILNQRVVIFLRKVLRPISNLSSDL